MPNVYNPNKKLYRNAQGYIPRAKVRREIAKLTKHVQKEARRYARKYNAGGNIAEFENDMRDLLKSAHIIAASVGRGGRERMTQRDWGVVGAKIKWQYGFLAKFAAKVAKGVTQAISEYRAASYASAIYISYQTAQLEEMQDAPERQLSGMRARLIQNSEEGCPECTADADKGWMPVEDMTEIGGRLCGDFCKCFIEFEGEELEVPDIMGAAMRVVFGE